jgi:hypothetical protein
MQVWRDPMVPKSMREREFIALLRHFGHLDDVIESEYPRQQQQPQMHRDQMHQHQRGVRNSNSGSGEHSNLEASENYLHSKLEASENSTHSSFIRNERQYRQQPSHVGESEHGDYAASRRPHSPQAHPRWEGGSDVHLEASRPDSRGGSRRARNENDESGRGVRGIRDVDNRAPSSVTKSPNHSARSLRSSSSLAVPSPHPAHQDQHQRQYSRDEYDSQRNQADQSVSVGGSASENGFDGTQVGGALLAHTQ